MTEKILKVFGGLIILIMAFVSFNRFMENADYVQKKDEALVVEVSTNEIPSYCWLEMSEKAKTKTMKREYLKRAYENCTYTYTLTIVYDGKEYTIIRDEEAEVGSFVSIEVTDILSKNELISRKIR